MAETRTVIELTEYLPHTLESSQLPLEVGERLWREYREQVSVEFPSPRTNYRWSLTAEGWIGFIPLTAELAILMRPRVPLANLFRMLEYAYRLRSFKFLDALYDVETLTDFYERLANVLARRIQDRVRRGLYRAYISEHERLASVRGRIDLRRLASAPWEVQLDCEFQEHTADIEENRILAWTMEVVARSGLCTERVLPTVRSAHRALQGSVAILPVPAEACVGRHYDRLNGDYAPMHALCRFFLEHSGPSHELGARRTLPFLVNMPRLYERFVAEWLTVHGPAGLRVSRQEPFAVGNEGDLQFNIDLALYDENSGECAYVMDTKYKTTAQPTPADVAQVVAYAELTGSKRAGLIYPGSGAGAVNYRVGGIHVRRLTFGLWGDLEMRGEEFVEEAFGVSSATSFNL